MYNQHRALIEWVDDGRIELKKVFNCINYCKFNRIKMRFKCKLLLFKLEGTNSTLLVSKIIRMFIKIVLEKQATV